MTDPTILLADQIAACERASELIERFWNPDGPTVEIMPGDDVLLQAAAATLRGLQWRPIKEAPRDRLIEVYAPAYPFPPPEQPLPAITCTTMWHPDGGFCVCELRTPTHYREIPRPLAPDADQLWCMHIIGPDEFMAAPSQAAAEAHVTAMRAAFASRPAVDVLLEFTVAPWPWDAESHAKDWPRWHHLDGGVKTMGEAAAPDADQHGGGR